MQSHEFTLGHRWVDQLFAGIALINTLLGYRPVASAKTTPTPQDLVDILNDIAAGRYEPSRYFVLGAGTSRSLIAEPPLLSPHRSYLLIVLNASTPRGEAVSTTAGGVAFEEPAWALLAAYSIHNGRVPMVAVPSARTNAGLWQRLVSADADVNAGTFSPTHYFSKIGGFLASDGKPHFALIGVSSEQLAALRDRGMQTLAVSRPPKFFEMFDSTTLKAPRP